jgi:hypothetical protein
MEIIGIGKAGAAFIHIRITGKKLLLALRQELEMNQREAGGRIYISKHIVSQSQGIYRD